MEDFLLEQYDSFLGIGKKAQARKKQRQTARQDRKMVKAKSKADKRAAKQARKTSRMQNRADRKQSVVNRFFDTRDARQARLTMKAEAKQGRKDAETAAQISQAEFEQMRNYQEPTPYVSEAQEAYEYAEQNNVQPSPTELMKAQRYLERRNVIPEPGFIPQQFYEERGNQMQEEVQMIYDDPTSYYEDFGLEDDGYGYFPEDWEADYEELHDDIMEEEFEAFDNSFDADEVDYLDPVTIGIVASAAKKGIDKYRESRFAKGKKFLGKSKSEYEAAQKRREESEFKAAKDEVGKSIKKDLEDRGEKEWLEKNWPILAIGVLGLFALGRSSK